MNAAGEKAFHQVLKKTLAFIIGTLNWAAAL
jgi:hypothetical protein